MSCPSCYGVGENLGAVLANEVYSYEWNLNLREVLLSAKGGCSFCQFIDHYILSPWYTWKTEAEANEEWFRNLRLSPLPTCFPSDPLLPMCNQNESLYRWAGSDSSLACKFCSNMCANSGDESLYCIKCMASERLHEAVHAYCGGCLRHVARRIADAVKYGALPLGTERSHFYLRIRFDQHGKDLRIHHKDFSGLYSRARFFTLETLKGSGLPGFVARNPPPDADNSSPRALLQIQQWLVACNSHGCYLVTKFQPTRLIEIHTATDNPQLRIVETKHLATSIVQYAALSYCWGGPQHSQTITANIAERLTKLDEAELPTTLRDAIRVCRNLGISFLWVDSLCIIQDSPNEKYREISSMDDVYKNAFVTISASRASAATEGFLGPRETDWRLTSRKWAEPSSSTPTSVRISSVRARLDLYRKGNYIGTISLRETIREEDLSHEPILRRAWTYQERLLSRRLLSFGYDLTWTCGRGHKVDTGGSILTYKDSDGQIAGDSDKQHPGKRNERDAEDWTPWGSGIITHTLLQPDTQLDSATTMGIWNEILQQYPSRELSSESDRLPALAGLVSQLASLNGDDVYMAGLWKSHFPHCLLWKEASTSTSSAFAYRNSHGLRQSEHYEKNCPGSSRFREWMGPSWSWISLMLPNHIGFTTDRSAKTVAELLSFEGTPINEAAPFGQLKKASLRISGQIGKARRRWYIPRHSNACAETGRTDHGRMVPIRVGAVAFLGEHIDNCVDEDMLPGCVRSVFFSEGDAHMSMTMIQSSSSDVLEVYLDGDRLHKATQLIQEGEDGDQLPDSRETGMYMISPEWLLPLTETVEEQEEEGGSTAPTRSHFVRQGVMETSRIALRSKGKIVVTRGLILVPAEQGAFERIGVFKGINLKNQTDITWGEIQDISLV